MTARADRILLVLPSLGRGGGERVMLQLARSFMAAGREVHLATLLGGGPLRAEVPEGAALHEMVAQDRVRGGFALACLALPRLVCLLRLIKPHAVLSTMTGTNLLSVMACLLAPGHVRLVLREASGLANVRSALKRLAMRWLYPRAGAIIAVSGGVALDLGSLGLPDARICVVHNPVDVDRLRQLAQIGPILPEIGAMPYVIAVGRLTEAKDYPTLLRAFSSSKLRHDHRLVILGEGEQRPMLERVVNELGLTARVFLPGALENPYRVMSRASLLVLSSRWEGCPNVLLEALALGIPVVATDCRYGPREILDEGRYGRLVPVQDADAMADAMDATSALSASDADAALAAYANPVVSARYLALLDGLYAGRAA